MAGIGSSAAVPSAAPPRRMSRLVLASLILVMHRSLM
jgi:hypothetical protein